MKFSHAKFLFLFIFVASLPIQASAKGLVISPKRVVFEKGQRIVEVILANRGDEEETYRISIVNKRMQENGQLTDATTPAENEFFAKDHLRYSPRQVVLGPKETQKVRLMSRLKSDAADGEYRSHLLIQEVPKADAAQKADAAEDGALGINVQAIFGISLPVIMRKGDLVAQTSLSSPKIKKIGEDTYLEVEINRTGTKSILGSLNVFAEEQKIGILKTVAVYMSSPKRVVSIKLDPERAKNLSGKTLRVTLGAEEAIEDAPETEISFTAP
ncbi:MAG: fimbrial biogenesis chaperone [Alphaproteobacteria bacterium]